MDIPQVSFGKGEVSPIAAARTDAQFYASALQQCVNFFIRVEGGASNRPGLEFIGNCLSNTPSGSYLLPFVYNNEQTYVEEFSSGAIQFYSDGSFVQNTSAQSTITGISVGGLMNHKVMTVQAANAFIAGQTVTISGVTSTGSLNVNQTWKVASANSISFTVNVVNGSVNYASGGVASVSLNLTNPYALADLPNLRWAQSADVLNVVVATQPLYQLTRVTANDFTLTAPQLLFGPFQDLNTDGTTYVYASATQGTVTLTASAPIFKPAHVGALFTIEEQFLSGIPPWTAQYYLEPITSGASPVGKYMRSDGKIYQCVAAASSSAGTMTGNFQPVHTSGTQMDGNGEVIPNVAGTVGVSWQFVSTNAGVAKIVQYIDAQHVLATVQSDKGVWSNFPPTVVGPPATVVGPFLFTGDGTTQTFSPLSVISTGDPNQYLVTVGGVFQDPSTYSINQLAVSITFYTPPPLGAAVSVAQVTGGGANNTLIGSIPLSTYWAFGSISAVQGYASDVCYYNDRLVLSGTQLQPQTLFTSVVSDYLNFGVSNPQVDSDAITETVNARQQNPINNLLPMNNLLLGTASASWRATDSSGIGAITPSNVSLIPQEFYGMAAVPAVQTGLTILYVQWGGRKIRDLIYNFYTDKFMGQELTLFARHIFPYGTSCTRVAYAPEPYGLAYCVRSDGVLCVCAYVPQLPSFQPEQQMMSWSRYITAGNFEDVCVVPENDSYSVYVIVGRTIGGTYQRYIERFAPREYASVNDAFFVDSGLTYDGRNTSSTTMVVTGGTTWLAGDTGTLTASGTAGWSGFDASDAALNNAIWLNDANGNRLCRLQITAVSTALSAQVQFLDPVPSALWNLADQNWTFARTLFLGLTNLIGETVSVFADGGVQATQTVAANGSITLTNAGGVVHAGLAYLGQLQSLNLNIQGQPSIRNRSKTIPGATVVVDESYPFQMGPDFVHLSPVVQRQYEPYTQPVAPYTGALGVQFYTEPADDAYVCAQVSDPVPVTLLSWVASVDIGEPQVG